MQALVQSELLSSTSCSSKHNYLDCSDNNCGQPAICSYYSCWLQKADKYIKSLLEHSIIKCTQLQYPVFSLNTSKEIHECQTVLWHGWYCHFIICSWTIMVCNLYPLTKKRIIQIKIISKCIGITQLVELLLRVIVYFIAF